MTGDCWFERIDLETLLQLSLTVQLLFTHEQIISMSPHLLLHIGRWKTRSWIWLICCHVEQEAVESWNRSLVSITLVLRVVDLALRTWLLCTMDGCIRRSIGLIMLWEDWIPQTLSLFIKFWGRDWARNNQWVRGFEVLKDLNILFFLRWIIESHLSICWWEYARFNVLVDLYEEVTLF